MPPYREPNGADRHRSRGNVNYAEEIYRGAGYNVNGILFNIVITGTINFACTLPAFAMVDRFGRRGLMLAGCAGVGTSHAPLALAYHFGVKGLPVLVLTLSTLGCFSMTLGPVAWVLIAEIFPIGCARWRSPSPSPRCGSRVPAPPSPSLLPTRRSVRPAHSGLYAFICYAGS